MGKVNIEDFHSRAPLRYSTDGFPKSRPKGKSATFACCAPDRSVLAPWFHDWLVGTQPIDKAALQTLVDTTARELLIPGAVVLLRTPQGEFTVSYGTTLLGANSPPQADAHHLDQSDCITRRPADRQYPLGEGARSDLRGVTASISAQAPQPGRFRLTRLLITNGH